MTVGKHVAGRVAFVACLFGPWLFAAAQPAAVHAQEAPAPAAVQPVEAEPDVPGVPVIYRGQELWKIYAPIGPFSPEERARSAAARIDALVRDNSLRPDELTLAHEAATSRFLLRGRVVGVITDQDAAAAGLPRRELAERTLSDVQRVITETRAEFSTKAILWSVLTALLATLAVWAIAFVATRLFRRALVAVEKWGVRLSRRAEEDDLPLVARRQVAMLAVPALRLARFVAFAAIALLWLEVVLAALPWSRPSARRVMDYVEEPIRFVGDSFVASLPSLFYLFVIGVIASYALRLVRFFFAEIGRGTVRFESFPSDWAQPTYRLARVLLIALALVAAYPYIPGSSSPAFQGISVFLGLLISLSSSAAIGNIVSGTVLTYTGGFRLNDRVRIGDTTGDIVETSMLVTKIRTIKNVVVSIPNAVVLTSPMVNYSALARKDGLILHTGVTIGYDAPWRQVHDLLLAAARRTPGIVEAPAPFVLQTALNDFYVAYEINAYTHEAQRMAQIYSDLHANIQDAFNEAGVEIMSPHYASLRDGNTIAIPGDYVVPGQEARAFRVNAAPSPPLAP